MNTRRVRLVAASLLCLAWVPSGCRAREGGTATGGKPLKLAFVTNNSADFWTIARRGVEKADAELPDVEAEFRLTADGTAAEQQRIVDDLLTKGVDAIAISPVDPQNQTAMIDAAAKRAIVFTQDSDAPQTARTCYIGTDNLAAGRQAGQLIREAIPAGGAVMLFVGKLDARNAQERVQGIREALAGSNVRVIDVRTDDVDDVRAKANAADTLVRYPDIQGLVGLWSYNGPAILNAKPERPGASASLPSTKRTRRSLVSGPVPYTPPLSSSRTSSVTRRSGAWRRRYAAIGRSSPPAGK
jgi:ribose transport system substrate-binding protein